MASYLCRSPMELYFIEINTSGIFWMDHLCQGAVQGSRSLSLSPEVCWSLRWIEFEAWENREYEG